VTPGEPIAIAAAVKEHEETAAANNRRLFSRLQAVPGAMEALRRFLAADGLTGPQIDELLTGEVPIGTFRGLLGVTTKDN